MARETAPAPREERTPPARFADPFDALRGEMNALMDSFFGRGFPSLARLPDVSTTGEMVPRMNVRENEKEIAIEVELPGMDEKDVSVTLQNGIVTMKGEKSFEKQDDKDDYHILERRYGSFQRALRLPDTVDDAAAEARFDKGVLTVRIPKRPEAAGQEKRIEIKSG